MKKLFFITMVILAFSILNAEKKISYGLKIGGNIANQTFKHSEFPDLDTDNRLGFTTGIFAEYNVNPNFSFLFEGDYVQKGMQFDLDYTDENGIVYKKVTKDNHVDYLSVPMLGKYSLNIKTAKIYAIAGPRLDVLLGYSGMMENVYDEFDSVDFGATFGLGYEFHLVNSRNLLLEMRYSPSLTNSYETDLLKVKNSSFEFYTGIKF